MDTPPAPIANRCFSITECDRESFFCDNYARQRYSLGEAHLRHGARGIRVMSYTSALTSGRLMPNKTATIIFIIIIISNIIPATSNLC